MKFATLTSCTDNYTWWLNGQLNSLDWCGFRGEVHVIAIDLAPDYLSRIRAAAWTFDLHIYDVSLGDFARYSDQGGKNMMSKKSRYEYLERFADYDALCFLDADMLAVRPLDNFFEMVAGTGVIVGSNERFKWNLGNYWFGEERLPARPMSWMICNAPLFFCPKRQQGFIRKAAEATTKVWDIQKQRIPSDLFCMNVALFAAGVTERVVALPMHCWTGVHRAYIDIGTRVKKGGEGWVSETGEPVYMLHGRWKEGNDQGPIGALEKKMAELGMAEDRRERHRREALAVLEAIRGEWRFFNHEWKVAHSGVEGGTG